MSRFSFQSRRQGFGAGRRRPNNKGMLGGLNLGIGLFIVFVSGQIPGARLAGVLGLPFLAAAWFVFKERRLGLNLTYFGSAIIAVLSVITLLLSGNLLFGLVIGFAVYYLVKQATQFDAFLEQREMDAFDKIAKPEQDASPPSARERFEQKNRGGKKW